MSRIRRRRFIAALGAGAFASSFICQARGAKAVARIGILVSARSKSEWSRIRRRQFEESLHRAGYKVGADTLVDWRYAEGHPERLYALAVDLVAKKSDVIVAFASSDAVYAARNATTISRTPVVTYAIGTHIARLLSNETLAQPAFNVTGTVFSTDDTDTYLKRFQILKEAVPNAIRVVWLEFSNPTSEYVAYLGLEKFGFDVTVLRIRSADELQSALQKIAKLEPEALFVGGGLASYSTLIAALALRTKLVSIAPSPRFVMEGGLLSYGPNVPAMLDRTVNFVVRILRGAKPEDLPFELPASYDLMFNARTAAAIGYTPPHALRLRFDRVIE